MPNLVIVALPAEDDYVNKISSEKVAHMTLLFLGEVDKVQNFSKILNFVNHAASQSLVRFGLEVDRRAELGADKADVIFFSKDKWSGFERVNEFRSFLLQDNNIRVAYDSIEQFPEWLPHLTLGYPDSPAKEDDRDYPGINYVNFDRIAVWFGDYEGIEFPLKRHEWEAEVAMDNVKAKTVVDNILEHFGVKGMKWGVRNKSRSVTVSDKGRKLKTSGGHGRPASGDAVRARTTGQIGKKSGLKALSDQELESYRRRLQLESSVKRLEFEEKSPARRFVGKILQEQGSKAANQIGDEATRRVRRKVFKAATAAAVG